MANEEEMTPPPKKSGGDVVAGFFMVLLLHIIVFFVGGFMSGGLVWMGLFAIGVVQLLYIVPAVLYFRAKQQTGIVQGLWIGAGVTFLLNAACYGYFASI